jgi:hypothetical protein
METTCQIFTHRRTHAPLVAAPVTLLELASVRFERIKNAS